MRFQFEKKVIDPILNLIKKHQVFLTQKENLPQLAKLGYMYNKFWYMGRVCYGYDGIIAKTRNGDCEDNPKYKIEMCDPETQEIDNYIYDAWGMHVSNDDWKDPITFDVFKNLILNNEKVYSELELLELQPNKTLDEWVEVKLHPDYRYKSIYPNRKSVLNHLLCTIGNGYGFKNGLIFGEAGGADMDETDYAQWENAQLDEKLLPTIEKILSYPQVEEVFIEHGKFRNRHLEEEKKDKAENGIEAFLEKLKQLDPEVWQELKQKQIVDDEEKYRPYYPISDSSIIWKLNKKSHPSYIKGGLEVCRDILAHQEEEANGGFREAYQWDNINFAKKFVEKFKDYDKEAT